MNFNTSPDDLLGARLPEEGPALEEAPLAGSSVSFSDGLSIQQLAIVFRKSPETIRKKLFDCPPKKKIGNGYRYDLAEAAKYIVEPVIDITERLRKLSKSDLPPALQKDVWDARLKQQKWALEAQQLWHTEDVVQTLSMVFVVVKSALQLWPDTVERQEGLTNEQRAVLVEMCDDLQNEIHSSLHKAIAERSTEASVRDFEVETELDWAPDD